MNTQKPVPRKDPDLYVYVNFTIPSETSTNAQDVKLRKILEAVIPEGYEREYSSHSESGGEIIYSFQRPLLVSPSDNEVFFEKLKKIFDQTAELIPHFTQPVSSEGV